MYDSPSSQVQATFHSGTSPYGKGRAEHKRMSSPSSFIRWLQVKKYQYEVTLPLYMLTPTERIVFNVTLLLLASMLMLATILYLPNHISIIYHRILYYVEGSSVSTHIAGAVKTTRAALISQTTTAILRETTETVLKEL